MSQDMDDSDGPELADDGEAESETTVAGRAGTASEQESQNGQRPSGRERTDGPIQSGTADATESQVRGPTITDEMTDRIARTLENGPHVDGPATAAFETAFADYHEIDHAVTVDSGTSALFVALRAAGVGPGDDVFVPAYGPFTTVSTVLTLGATPVFVDVNPATYTMGVFTLERAIESAANPTAVVPVHVHGQPADLHLIDGLASQYDLALVEDARPALGATYQNDRVGTIGDIGCFSFDPTRSLTVGGNGGMLVTDNADLAEEIRVFRNEGLDRHGVRCRPGLNHRLDEVSAIVGREQLAHLPAALERRREIAMQYHKRLAALPRVRLPTARRDARHAYSSFVIHVPDCEGLAAALEAADVSTDQPYPVPADRHPAVRAHVDDVPDVRYADRLCDRLLALPIDSDMTDAEVEDICATIETHCD
jgi:perosamine synthetase